MQANPAVKWSRDTLTLGQVEPNQQIFLAQEANWGNFRPSFGCVLLAYLLLGPKFPCLRQTLCLSFRTPYKVVSNRAGRLNPSWKNLCIDPIPSIWFEAGIPRSFSPLDRFLRKKSIEIESHYRLLIERSRSSSQSAGCFADSGLRLNEASINYIRDPPPGRMRSPNTKTQPVQVIQQLW